MITRNIQCSPLQHVFVDLERAGLNMSWVYGNIGSILSKAQIAVYAVAPNIHEKVDIHRLKLEFVNEDPHEVSWRVSLLGSALGKNGVADRDKICAFLLGNADSYDNVENFNVIYDFKELIADAISPFLIPAQIAAGITSCEWKAASLLRDFSGHDAIIFSRANQLRRLHKSTVMRVQLGELQVEDKCLAKLLSLLTSLHHAEIVSSRPEPPQKKNRGGRPPKAWWDDFWVEFWSRLYAGDIEPKSQTDVKKEMINILEERDWLLDDKELNEPARKSWVRIKPEVERINFREN